MTTTRERLRSAALRLFTERGFDAVTVAQVAAEAGVSHMTFFRHFPTKEAVVVADVLDPVIAEAIAAQSVGLPPMERAVWGMLAALDVEAARAELGSVEFRRRVALAASTSTLRAAVWGASEESRQTIAHALEGPGVDTVQARVVAAAIIGAATTVLLDWAADPGDETSPADVLRTGLTSLLGSTT